MIVENSLFFYDQPIFLILLLCSECFAAEKNEIDVNFEILTGSGDDDYYVGDYFFYSIAFFSQLKNVVI